MIPFTRNVQNKQIHETESRLEAVRGWGAWIGSDCSWVWVSFEGKRKCSGSSGDGCTIL